MSTLRRHWPLLFVLALICSLPGCIREINSDATRDKFPPPTITAALIPESVCIFKLHTADSYWLSDKDWINIAVLPPIVPQATYTYGVMDPTNSDADESCTIATDSGKCLDDKGRPQPSFLVSGHSHPMFPGFSVNILECTQSMSPCPVLQIPNPPGLPQPANFTIPIDDGLLSALQDKGFPVAPEDATYQIQPVLNLYDFGIVAGVTVGSLKVKLVPSGMTGNYNQSLSNAGAADDNWTWPDPAGFPWTENFSTNLQVTQVYITDDLNNDARVPFCGISTARNHDCGCNGDPSFSQGPCTSVNIDNHCSNSAQTFLTPTNLHTDPLSPVGPDSTLSWDPIFSTCHAPPQDLRSSKLTLHFILAPRANVPTQTAAVPCPRP